MAKDSKRTKTLLKNFLDYYNYEVQQLDTKYLPRDLFNFFHENNNGASYIYSGSKDYSAIPFPNDWTTCQLTAEAFSGDTGFIVEMSLGGFMKRFNYISMDVLYDYLKERVKDPINLIKLEAYVSESEVYAVNLK